MTALILAGGQSRRFGQDKAWVMLAGKPVIRQVVEVLAATFTEVLIVGADSPQYQQLGVKIIPDQQPGEGPLGGLYSGLTASSSPWVFCCACDMPFLNPLLIAALQKQIQTDADALVCRFGGQLHPLHAFYSQNCLPIIKQMLDLEQRRMRDLLANLRVKYIDDEFISPLDRQGASFFNLNTPESVQQAIEIARNNPI